MPRKSKRPRHIERKRGALHPQQRQHRQDERAGAGQRHAPGKRKRQRHQHGRRQRPAEAAGDAVDTERMAEARRVHLAVEQGEVDRMEDAIADAGHDGEQQQHRVMRAGREAEGRSGQQTEAGEQDRPRAEAVDDEARQRLHGARDDEEDRHQEPELRVADRERFLQPREQRRQQELAEVADAVRDADEGDQGRVLAHAGSRQGNRAHREDDRKAGKSLW
jgi:hypothetical protein